MFVAECEECWRPRRGCCACCRCCSPTRLDRARTRRPARGRRAHRPQRRRTAARARLSGATPPAGGRRLPARRRRRSCRRCCSTTTRPSRSPSACARGHRRRHRRSRRPRCGRWPSSSRCSRAAAPPGQRRSPSTPCRCRPTPRPPRSTRTCCTTLAAACRDHERLRFDYRRPRRHHDRREVEPYRLVQLGRRWYLVAWDLERDGLADVPGRPDRAADPAGPRFTPRPLPADDVAAYGCAAACRRPRGGTGPR